MSKFPERAAYVAAFGAITAAAVVVIALILFDNSGGRDGSVGTGVVVDQPAYSQLNEGKICCPPGMRAFHLIIDPVTSEGASVVPGDRVDLTVESEGGVTRAVQDLEVLAVGTVYPPSEYETTAEPRGQPSVTLAADTERARLVAEALSLGGQITLSHSS